MARAKGILSIILHAHLPYIRHLEREKTLEELWLFEAITESYLPLLMMLERLAADNVPCRLTISITPTLGSMLQDHLLTERYLKYLDQMIDLSGKEVERVRFQPQFYPLAKMYHQIYKNSKDYYVNKYHKDLVSAFAGFQRQGLLEIIASAATHGFLPLMDREEAIAAQIKVGTNWYRSRFNCDPVGFWLPECGYCPGVESELHRQGIKYVILDTHGILHGVPRPRYASYAPVLSKAGVAFFGRDMESSKQVWSSTEGYPGDYFYRDFYRDIGYDLDYEYIKPYLYSDHRGNTGIKYYRITGENVEKQPYCPDMAREKAAEHAGNFMFNREKQVEHICQYMDREPIVVAPYDAELFGHWWFEGPMWLEYLVRKIAFDQETIKLGTCGEYLNRYPVNQVVQPSMSSWGFNGYNEVWLDNCNDWIYRHLSTIAAEMVDLAAREDNQPLITRALNQAAREVLLAQSSDWAFIMKAGTTAEYAAYRTKLHIQQFWRLHGQICAQNIDEGYLKKLEDTDNIFPDIDYRVFSKENAPKALAYII